MQKYWLPFRSLEKLDKSTQQQTTLIAEPTRKEILNSSNLTETESFTTRNVQFAKTVTFANDGVKNTLTEKPRAVPSRMSEDLTETQINKSNIIQHGFTTALSYPSSNNDRKRSSTLTEEPRRKKFQSNNDI